MISREELQAMGIALDDEDDKRLQEKQRQEQEEKGKYKGVLLISFLVPIIGVIAGIVHVDKNNDLANSCFTCSAIGFALSFILIMLMLM